MDAARAIDPHLARLEALVLAELRRRGAWGGCNHELEAWLGLAGNTVRPRVRNLVLRGLVKHGGEYRITPSGRRARVWVAT